MAIDYDKLLALEIPDAEHTYTDKDTILYALGVGLGQDPLDPKQLDFVYEKHLKALPTYAAMLGYPGFWRLAAKHWRTGAGEVWRSLSKRAFARALQRLVPDVRAEHLTPAPAGVRAQALASDGALVDDFLIRESGRVVHVLNAPSPAAAICSATSSRPPTRWWDTPC